MILTVLWLKDPDNPSKLGYLNLNCHVENLPKLGYFHLNCDVVYYIL